jgi:hypothetical protein
MPTYNSDAFRKGTRYRATRDGAFELSASVRLPAGRALVSGDVLNFFTVGPGIDILELSLSTSAPLLDTTSGVFALGTDADANNFINAGSTAFQSGARNVKVERASFNAVFNPSVVVPATVNAPRTSASIASSARITAPTGTRILRITWGTAGTQTNSDDVERIITLSGKFAPLAVTTPTQIPYIYADRRDNTTLSSGGLVS